jgi:hypothetical protein
MEKIKDGYISCKRFLDGPFTVAVISGIIVLIVTFFLNDVNAQLKNKVGQEEHNKDIQGVKEMVVQQNKATQEKLDILIDVLGAKPRIAKKGP